ncbi:hypothetical protein, conserved [Eimeria acervulina]|uniref:Uncharacterized protein n=1 Tax=Eimeria acervulina TaxID=5801 RepID=U6GEQ8_EIMAC|nr:hypothetical protein, conserved [Eimeria acervulina]CDI77029.1 hypothetical protein, conserved [Eimeria acervulina]
MPIGDTNYGLGEPTAEMSFLEDEDGGPFNVEGPLDIAAEEVDDEELMKQDKEAFAAVLGTYFMTPEERQVHQQQRLEKQMRLGLLLLLLSVGIMEIIFRVYFDKAAQQMQQQYRSDFPGRAPLPPQFLSVLLPSPAATGLFVFIFLSIYISLAGALLSLYKLISSKLDARETKAPAIPAAAADDDADEQQQEEEEQQQQQQGIQGSPAATQQIDEGLAAQIQAEAINPEHEES